MKSIDEVITALEICISGSYCVDKCPYAHDDCLEHGMEKDSLHYLKEYRELLNKPRSQRLIDVLREVRGEK